MAEFEGIHRRHFQSPIPARPNISKFSWRKMVGFSDSQVLFFFIYFLYLFNMSIALSTDSVRVSKSAFSLRISVNLYFTLEIYFCVGCYVSKLISTVLFPLLAILSSFVVSFPHITTHKTAFQPQFSVE
jgi:hypothetical protein